MEKSHIILFIPLIIYINQYIKYIHIHTIYNNLRFINYFQTLFNYQKLDKKSLFHIKEFIITHNIHLNLLNNLFYKSYIYL